MKKMHVLFTVLMLTASLCLVAQETKKLTAEFESVKEILISKDSKTSSNFTVATDKSKIDDIQRQADNYGNYLNLSISPVKNEQDKYSMSLQFNHDALLTEIHKTLFAFGFSDITIDKRAYPLNQLLTIKK